ncbi:SOS response-associated peptidase family protein [Arthrobacter sp. MDT2-16]
MEGMASMCGRFVIAGNKAAIWDAFSVDGSFQDEVKPSWNVAPMQGIPFVCEQLREGELVRRLEIARWGLVPVWSKDPNAGARILCTSACKSLSTTSKGLLRSRCPYRCRPDVYIKVDVSTFYMSKVGVKQLGRQQHHGSTCGLFRLSGSCCAVIDRLIS